jgi:group II intron reverse transcriptase/maturase
MQKKLSQWATENPEAQYRELYHLLCTEIWLRVAHHKVNANQGRETAGIDGESLSNFNGNLDGNLEELRQLLQAKTFEPRPVRRVYIPKANGKKRPLGIPGIRDRIVQEALRMILEPIWEADFSMHSYGFRPNRSTYDAMTYIGKRFAGNGGSNYQWIIEGDIASYFDTIPHRRLIKVIKKRVADRNIRELIWKFLRAGVMYRKSIEETLTGTPQGGIVSPLLANIYLHAMDKYMESKYLNLPYHIRDKRRNQGKGNFLYVRYADDFVVLCNGTKAEALAMKEELKELLSTMGLTLSEEKTKVTHITEGFDFLGYRVIRSMGQNGKMVAKVLIPEKAVKKFQQKIRHIFDPSSTNESVNAKIQAQNWLTRGWCEYYRSTNSPSIWFGKLSNELYWLAAHWLGRKYKSNIPAIMRRFKKDNTFGTKTRKLVRPDEYKAKRFVAKTWHNPYTEKEAVKEEKDRIKREILFSYDKIWIGDHHRPGEMDLREEAIALKGTTCELCGTTLHPSEVEVDHKRLRTRFKDIKEANSMDNLQILCTPCHRAKTKTDLKVLSRMR